MARHDDAGPFVRVGRIEIGRPRIGFSSGAETGLVTAAIPIKDPRGAIEEFSGVGADLSAAIADALKSLAKIPFAIDTVTAADGLLEDDRRAVRVLVRALDERQPRYAVGHAVAEDQATAIANATARGLAVGGFLQRRLLPPGAPDVESSTERIVQGIGGLFPRTPLPPETVGAIRELVAQEINRFGEGQAIVAAHSPNPEGMLTRFDAQAALAQAEGEAKTSDTRTSLWWEWFPGLDNDTRTLREVLSDLPAAPATKIPWIVRVFENDKGWLRLHGAVNLKNHDMIHVLLGRGLLDQDEAFVIGFTMGSTKAVSRLERWFFKFAVSNLYPEPYRISRRMLVAYDLGLEAGEEFGVKNLHLVLRDDMLDQPLGETRRELQIDTHRLRQFYARERIALPGTLASLRLPVED
ncbi:MAG: hypothetical protein WCJ18_08360 [Planctomycetota bacterium]